ncbi:MAG: fibronectin type III domain-containing protein, partial [Chloroflexota bacterium]
RQSDGLPPPRAMRISGLTSCATQSTNFAYNRIVITDNTLVTFLTQKDRDCADTQTIAPVDVTVTILSDSTVQLSWTPIAFKDKGGYYEINMTNKGSYTTHGTTHTKSDNAYVITGLDAGTTYTFRLRTYTPPHDRNPSGLWSDYSNPITAKTWVAPNPPTNTPTFTHTPIRPLTNTPTNTPVPPTSTLPPMPVSTPTSTPTYAPVPPTPASTNTPVPPTTTYTPVPTYTAIPTAPLSSGADVHEPNDDCANATIIQPDGAPQPHTFHASADTDWTQFTVSTAGIYRIEVTIPDNSSADVDLYYYKDCGTFHEDQFVNTFAPGARIDVEAEAGQGFFVKAKQFDPLIYGPDVSYNLSIRKMPSETDNEGNVIIPIPAIVVAGRYRGADPAQDNIDATALYAYDLFKAKGREDSEIFFLATTASLGTDSSSPIVDGEATERNLEYGITEWGKAQLQREHVSQVLTLYLVDHGGPDLFYLDNLSQEILTSNDLDAWLSELEDEFPGLLVNVIIEACQAGSFINRQDGSISSEGRVIITSSNENYDAYVSRNGAAFSDEFITFLWEDYSLFYSFQASRNSVQQHHRYQRPWLDADGDGEPNEIEDFAIASLRSFANAGTLSSTWPPYIAGIDVITTNATRQFQFHADVRHQFGNESIQSVWGVVYPPDYIQPTGEAAYEDDGELNAESLDIIEFVAADGVQALYIGGDDTHFTQMGVYRIVVYARDRHGLQARPMTVEVEVGYRVFLPTVSR